MELTISIKDLINCNNVVIEVYIKFDCLWISIKWNAIKCLRGCPRRGRLPRLGENYDQRRELKRFRNCSHRTNDCDSPSPRSRVFSLRECRTVKTAYETLVVSVEKVSHIWRLLYPKSVSEGYSKIWLGLVQNGLAKKSWGPNHARIQLSACDSEFRYFEALYCCISTESLISGAFCVARNTIEELEHLSYKRFPLTSKSQVSGVLDMWANEDENGKSK